MKISIHNTLDRDNRTIGDIILEALDSKGMKQSELCDFTGIPKPSLNDVVKGRRNLTAEMAVLIESALGLSADWLLAIQIRDELDKAYNDSKVVHQLKCMSDWEQMKTHVSIPVLKKFDMYKPGVADKVETIMAMFRVKDINDFLEITKQESTQTYFKKSERLNIDNAALFTWKHYCFFVASQKKMSRPYNPNMIDELKIKLLHIITENIDTYKRVESTFAAYGVRLLYIDKVGQVPVDGMSFWIDENPTVVLTRRLSNIDNFAFSVMHELGHVKLHLKKDEPALINLDGMDFDDKEAEANQFARDAFIPQDQWDLFMKCISDCNPYAVHVPIAEEARRLDIHPQILFGRYMHDTGLYRLRRVFPTDIN